MLRELHVYHTHAIYNDQLRIRHDPSQRDLHAMIDVTLGARKKQCEKKSAKRLTTNFD